MRGKAEATVLKEKNTAMKDGSFVAQLEMLKILSVSQIDTAGKIAEALGKNNKIMYLPVEENGNLLSNFLPKIDAMLNSGLPEDLMDTLKGKKKSKK